MVNGFDGSRAAGLPPATRELLAPPGGRARRRVPAVLRPSRSSSSAARASTCTTRTGDAYLDAYNNVPSVGHSHPRVTEAVTQAARHAQHAHQVPDRGRRRLRRAAARHARPRRARRTRCSPAPAARRTTWRCASPGSYTGGTGVIVTANAYHGVTAAVAELSPSLGPERPARPRTSGWCPRRSAGRELHRRGRLGHRRPANGTACGWRRSWPTRCSPPTACCPDPAGFLAPVAEIMRARGRPVHRRRGAVRVRADRHAHVGVPAARASCRTSSRWASRWATGCRSPGWSPGRTCSTTSGRGRRYFNTFGGNPVCVAAASAVLDVLDGRGAARQRGGDRRVPQGRARPPRGGQPGARRGARRRACTWASTSSPGDRRAVGRAGRGDRQRDARAPRADQRHRPARAACSRSGRRCPSARSTPTSSSRPSPRSPPAWADPAGVTGGAQPAWSCRAERSHRSAGRDGTGRLAGRSYSVL